MLAVAGGALGLLLATYGVRLFEAAMADSGKPYWLVFTLDYNVVIYVAAVCIATALVFGLAPALQVTKKDNSITLKENARGVAGSRRMRRWSGALVVIELTLAVTLLAGAGLMIRSFYNHYALNLGFSPDHLVTFGFDLLDHDYRDDDAIRGVRWPIGAAHRRDPGHRKRRRHDRRSAARPDGAHAGDRAATPT